MKTENKRDWTMPVLLFCSVLLQPSSWILRQLMPDFGSEVVRYDVIVLTQELLLWLLPACILRPWRIKRVGAKQAVLPLLALALPMGVLAQAAGAGLRWMLPGGGESIPMPVTPMEWVLSVLALVIAPAICEEAFFRGCVTARLKEAGSPVIAMVFGTLIFACLHASAAGLPAYLLISAVCTLLMLATGRVIAPILAHMGFNAAALLLNLPGSPWLLLALLPLLLLIPPARPMQWKPANRLPDSDKIILILLAGVLIWRFLA